MIEENLEAHEEATAEKSAAEIALETPFEQINGELNRKVLNEIAKQQGITADALNMSATKFKRLKNDDLAAYIRAGKPQEQAEKKSSAPAADDFDILGFGMGIFNLAAAGSKSGDYTKLDHFIMSNVADRVTKSDSKLNISSNPQLLTNLLLSGGIVYGLARVVGFERIKGYATAAKIKIFGGTPANEPQTTKQ